MHDYRMFQAGQRVLLAVSGGIDSLVLCAILSLWQKKAPIDLFLQPIHIDHGFWKQGGGVPPSQALSPQLEKLGMELRIEPEWRLSTRRSCFLCARNRRSQLFAIAGKENYTAIAFGHHLDDILETFLLNAIYGGNLSTMVPRQELFGGTLSIVRPMAYLDKREIGEVASLFAFSALPDYCHLADRTRRESMRTILGEIVRLEPNAKQSMFTALANVRREYLLKSPETPNSSNAGPGYAGRGEEEHVYSPRRR